MENEQVSQPESNTPSAAPITTTPTETVPPQKSRLATASFVLGLVSFIPLVGFFTGIVAIILGIIGKSKKGIILGILGILFTVILYGSLFYFGFVAKDGPFNDMKIQLSQQVLTQNSGVIELYNKKHGQYPVTLEDLTKDGYSVFPTDHYLKPFFYKVSEDGTSYDLRSLGPDGQYGTSDDIFPTN